MSKKITQMTELVAPDNSDVIQVVDVSEASLDEKNKNITLATLKTFFESSGDEPVAQSNLLYVDANGFIGTPIKGDPTRPYQTYTAARDASSSDNDIIVLNGMHQTVLPVNKQTDSSITRIYAPTTQDGIEVTADNMVFAGLDDANDMPNGSKLFIYGDGTYLNSGVGSPPVIYMSGDPGCFVSIEANYFQFHTQSVLLSEGFDFNIKTAFFDYTSNFSTGAITSTTGKGVYKFNELILNKDLSANTELFGVPANDTGSILIYDIKSTRSNVAQSDSTHSILDESGNNFGSSGEIIIRNLINSVTELNINNGTNNVEYKLEGDIISYGNLGKDKNEITLSGAGVIQTADGLMSPQLLENQIIVKKASDFGVIDSTKEYFLDGIIDMGTTQIDLSGGKDLNIKGYDFGISGLTSSEDNYTMFTGADAGDVLWADFLIDVSGANSKVLELTDGTGFHACEIARINFNNCTSLGTLKGYRQGLETGTGRFGGTPELTLDGTWLGGYFIDTSIVRSLTDGVYPLYKAGATFVMNSRFRSNQNIDLPASASFLDFSASNFVNPSTLQLDGCIISRNGSIDATDTNLTPNINETDLASSWIGNLGLNNTFVGGRIRVTSEAQTVIAAGSTYYTINAGAHLADELQHFDNPSDMQLRHIGNQPRSFKISTQFAVEGTTSNVLSVRIAKWDDSASTLIYTLPLTRQVNSFVGGRDVAFFSGNTNISLDINDYIFFEIANNSGNDNVTLELDSYFIIEER
jgi:hypothetical protein